MQVSGSSFVSGGRQFDVISEGKSVAPGVKRAVMLGVKSAPLGQGGSLNFELSVDYAGVEQTLTVPSLSGH